jgi:hypothetical protein
MRRFLFVLLLVFLARPAAAQNVPMFATGVLTPGHAVALSQTGFPGSAVVQDAGPALAGGFTELGITNNGTPFCIRDLSQTHLLCLGANVNGGGVISYNPIGSGTPQGLELILNGVSFPLPGPGGTGPLLLAASLADLEATSTAGGSYAMRCGYTESGDAPCLVYEAGAAPCSLNGGNGDTGSQVKSSNSMCWLAIWPTGQPISPKQFGAIGNGVTNDYTAVQAALNAATLVNLPLWLGDHLYSIGSTLTHSVPTATVDIEGGQSVAGGQFASGCSFGLINTGGSINIINLSDGTDIVNGVCVEAATTAGTLTAGTAIQVGATATTGNTQSRITNNLVYNAYIAIEIGGPTTGTTQTSMPTVASNLVVAPSKIGIAQGLASAEASTNDTAIQNNVVICESGSNTAATGTEINDGATRFYGGNDNYNCNIGLAITASTVGAGKQSVSAQFITGVLGDTSITHDLLIEPSASAGIEYLHFDNWWTGVAVATDQAILISGTPTSFVQNVSFTGGTAHGGGTGNTNALVLLTGSVGHISFVGNHFVGDGGVSGQTGIADFSSGINNGVLTTSANIFNDNYFGWNDGTLATGIALAGTGPGDIVIGNNFDGIAAPIVCSNCGAATYQVTIAHNVGATFEFDSAIATTPAACTGAGSGGSITCAILPGSSRLHGIASLRPATTNSGTNGSIEIPISVGSFDVPLSTNGFDCSEWLANPGSAGTNWPIGSLVIDGSNTVAIWLLWIPGSALTAGDTYYLGWQCRPR